MNACSALENEDNLGDRLNKAGWRQGSFVPADGLHELLPGIGVPENAICLVITQSCDLVHTDCVEEPYFECLIGTPVAKADGNYTARKNPRRLHVTVLIDGDEQDVELVTWRWHQIDRNALRDHAPDPRCSISPFDLRTVTDWLAARYARAAFPDAFNMRRASAKEELKKAMKGAKSIAALHIALTSFEELEPGVDYGFTLLAIIAGKPPAPPNQVKKEMIVIVTKAAAALSGCAGLKEIIKSEVKYESEVNLLDLGMYVRFEDFDYVSVANPQLHAGPLPRS